MDKLRAIKLFVRLVDAGSFTAVADELNVTTSMISKEIRRLEEDLGTRLMHCYLLFPEPVCEVRKRTLGGGFFALPRG